MGAYFEGKFYRKQTLDLTLCWMGDIENEGITAHHNTVERPRNCLHVVAYGGFIITVMDQAFHVAAGGNLVQSVYMSVQRSTKFIDIKNLLMSQTDLLR